MEFAPQILVQNLDEILNIGLSLKPNTPAKSAFALMGTVPEESLNSEQMKYLKAGYSQSCTNYIRVPLGVDKIKFASEDFLERYRPLDAGVILQPPANYLAWHRDEPSASVKQRGDQGAASIYLLIFLEDWSPGQVLVFEQDSVSHWRKGDAVFWPSTEWHCSANLGFSEKRTLQVILSERSR